ncbi:MAG: hypothetical protein DRK00_11030 [Thermoprotei archaeon]|nr:MAG: hypothetical protein DRK00_11030 [Thermoprotei archaeon]
MSSSGKAVEVVRKALTTRVIVLGILMNLIGGVTDTLSHGPIGRHYVSLQLPLLAWVFIFYAISKYMRFSREEFGAFFAIGSVGGILTRIYGIAGYEITKSQLTHWNISVFNNGLNTPDFRPFIEPFVKSYLFPVNPKVWEIAWCGLGAGEALPWGEWIPSIAFWLVFCFVWFLWLNFMILLWWHPFAEVERMTFPTAIPDAYVIDAGSIKEGEEKPLLLRIAEAKFFWIGALIGIVVTLPDFLTWFWPIPPETRIGWFPVRTPWLSAIFPGAPTYWIFNVQETAYMVFAPLEVLNTVVLFHIIFSLIYPAIGITTGILPYQPGWTAGTYAYTEGPFKAAIFGDGLILGLAVFAIFLHRKYLLDSLKSVIGSSAPSEEKGFYRMIWLGLIASCILLLILFISIGSVPWISIVLLFCATMWWFGQLRANAEAGYSFLHGGGGFRSIDAVAAELGRATGAFSIPVKSEAIFGTMYQAALSTTYEHMHQGNPYCTMNVYAVAYKNGVNVKEIFTALMIGFTVLAPVIFVTRVWMINVFGKNNLRGDAWGWYAANAMNNRVRYYMTNTVPPYFMTTADWGLHVSMGFIASLIIMFARLRYPIISNFLHPVGIFLAGRWIGGFALCQISAWLIKFLILKVGGTKLWEDFGVPFFAGLLAGRWLTYVPFHIMVFFAETVPTIAARL